MRTAKKSLTLLVLMMFCASFSSALSLSKSKQDQCPVTRGKQNGAYLCWAPPLDFGYHNKAFTVVLGADNALYETHQGFIGDFVWSAWKQLLTGLSTGPSLTSSSVPEVTVTDSNGIKWCIAMNYLDRFDSPRKC